jgi:hypothetical protein
MNIANAIGEVFYRTIRVDDLDIFYREAGSNDGPAILLRAGLKAEGNYPSHSGVHGKASSPILITLLLVFGIWVQCRGLYPPATIFWPRHS